MPFGLMFNASFLAKTSLFTLEVFPAGTLKVYLDLEVLCRPLAMTLYNAVWFGIMQTTDRDTVMLHGSV